MRLVRTVSRPGLWLGLLSLAATAGCCIPGVPSGGGGGLKPLWTAPIDTEINPIPANGMLYATGKKAGDSEVRLFGLDAKTGAERWKSDFTPDEILYVTPAELAVADDKKQYHSLNPATGAEIEGVAKHHSGKWVYARRDTDRVYALGTDQKLTALSADDKPLWSIPLPINRFRPILVDNGVIAVSGTLEKDKSIWSGIFLVDAETGKAIGQRPGTKDRALSTVLLVNGVLYFVEEGKSTTHTVVEKHPDGSTTGHTEFGIDENTLYALDARTGKQRWTRKTNGDGEGMGDPLFVDGGTLYLRERTKDTNLPGPFYRGVSLSNGESRSEALTGREQLEVGPATHLGTVLFTLGRRTNVSWIHWDHPTQDSWIVATDLKTGKRLWKCEDLKKAYTSYPTAADGLVFLGVSNRVGGDGRSGVMAFSAAGK